MLLRYANSLLLVNAAINSNATTMLTRYCLLQYYPIHSKAAMLLHYDWYYFCLFNSSYKLVMAPLLQLLLYYAQ